MHLDGLHGCSKAALGAAKLVACVTYVLHCVTCSVSAGCMMSAGAVCSAANIPLCNFDSELAISIK